MSYWAGRRTVVTGGASFIGSHLVDRLAALGSDIAVVDNFSSGRLENLAQSPRASVTTLDLETADFDEVRRSLRGAEVVFHLAASHGGRGYIDSHPADVASNFAIDHRVFEAATLEGVDRVVYASSACVYPPALQDRTDSEYRLKESDCNTSSLVGSRSADGEYGWSKLIGEVQLGAFVRQYGLKGCSLRFVTAYGERENETHAIIALVYKAFQRANPFVVWGSGEQSRDFTYVSDLVEGTLLAAEKVRDGRAVNLGTGERHRLKDVARTILESIGYSPEVVFDRSRPTGVVSRALDISLARDLLGWEPRVSLREGLSRTIDWYTETHQFLGQVEPRLLTERT